MLDSTLKRYFEVYLDASLSDLDPGHFRVLPSERRSRKEEGWGRIDVIYAFLLDTACVLSVRPDLHKIVEQFVADLGHTDDLLNTDTQHALAVACHLTANIFTVNIFTSSQSAMIMHDAPGCRRMEQRDVQAYLDFQLGLSPNTDRDCCRKDIVRNIQDAIAYAVFDERGAILAASTAGHIGVMQDQIEEPGIATAPEYWRRGFAKATLSHSTRAIFRIGRIAVYRVSDTNIGSIRTAQSVGYHRIAQSVVFAT